MFPDLALDTLNIKRQVKLPNVKQDKHHRKEHAISEMHHDKKELLRLNII